MTDLTAIAKRLPSAPSGAPRPVGGGCIHSSYVWGDCFLKTNDLSQSDNFATEAAGLEAIAATGAIRVPEVIVHGIEGETAFLILERLKLVSSGDEAALGEQLAILHSHTAGAFGFDCDNFIGATPQPNPRTTSWVEFFTEHRIRHLLRLLGDRGLRFAGSDDFLRRLPDLLPPDPPASLIHGDLWAGNKAFLPDGTPVLFDPAAHHADPECDLAMTGLFGGFSARFHDAYRSVHPAPADEHDRHEIYRLYHLLNHALLFGGSYIDQAGAVISRFA
ncbi:fructosamine kinase family protein [Haloferula sp. A504]|uniref:fructosamine kinase family protein n=1 Tax=Haloferula sp. A504 TaxID=3373601 RepID=UPI0031C6B962|nr:fructosamine kinase family protein [Verrucomicrobiaceae bacterium E54]